MVTMMNCKKYMCIPSYLPEQSFLFPLENQKGTDHERKLECVKILEKASSNVRSFKTFLVAIGTEMFKGLVKLNVPPEYWCCGYLYGRGPEGALRIRDFIKGQERQVKGKNNCDNGQRLT